jgi:hypothetical protein
MLIHFQDNLSCIILEPGFITDCILLYINKDKIIADYINRTKIIADYIIVYQ